MAGKTNLPDIDQGAAYKHSFFWFNVPDPTNAPDVMTPIPLTGYEAKLQVRKKVGDQAVLAEWSTANGCITLIDNEVRIRVEASLTRSYTFAEGEYDLLLWPTIDTEDVTKLVYGQVKVIKAVTVL